MSLYLKQPLRVIHNIKRNEASVMRRIIALANSDLKLSRKRGVVGQRMRQKNSPS